MLYNYPSKVYNSVGLTQSQSCATMTTINFRTLPSLQKETLGISLVVQWLRLYTLNAGSPGSIPSQGTRSYMLQLRVCMPQRRLKILHATTKTQCNQINKQIKIFKTKQKKPCTYQQSLSKSLQLPNLQATNLFFLYTSSIYFNKNFQKTCIIQGNDSQRGTFWCVAGPRKEACGTVVALWLAHVKPHTFPRVKGSGKRCPDGSIPSLAQFLLVGPGVFNPLPQSFLSEKGTGKVPPKCPPHTHLTCSKDF